MRKNEYTMWVAMQMVENVTTVLLPNPCGFLEVAQPDCQFVKSPAFSL
jgi:hypothetical protein